jgi:glycine/D-amino acid oxidase-like deaminating enzyme
VTLGDAEFVIIGGGAVGLGVAHELARAGKSDILVIEREYDVGRATSSQGAGLAGQVRSSVERTRLAMHSVATFGELEKDPDARPEWHPVGSLRIAETPERVEEFSRLEEVARRAGLEASRIGNEEASRLWPAMDFARARAILWCPTDGYMNPASVVKCYEHRCRRMGVRFAVSTTLEGITVRDGRVQAVQTSRGAVQCRHAVNAAGAHAYHVARLVGLELPIFPVRHEYFVTVRIEGLHPGLPCFRLPDAGLYGRPSGDGLLLGGWEGTSLRQDPRQYSLGSAPPAVEPDARVLESFERSFRPFFPRAEGAEYRRVGKGWPTFTPDGKFILGESSAVKGFVMAGGCNAHGISGSAGIGKLLVESLLDPRPSEYVKSLSPDRFATGWDWAAASRRAQEVYERYYAIESC